MRGEGEIANIGGRRQKAESRRKKAESILGHPTIVIPFLRGNNYNFPTPRPGSAAKFVECHIVTTFARRSAATNRLPLCWRGSLLRELAKRALAL
jgi:hypothetical protein